MIVIDLQKITEVVISISVSEITPENISDIGVSFMLMLTRYIIFAKNKHYITFTIHDKNIKKHLEFC